MSDSIDTITDSSDALAALPPLDRERLPRQPLVPRWAQWLALIALAVSVLAVGGALVSSYNATALVPTVVGANEGTARTELERAGLVMTVADRRFSREPAGTVLEQSPAPGAEVEAGSEVLLVLSAGTDEFAMPDVIGDGVLLALGTLEGQGLLVNVETVISEEQSGTVLSTIPAAGSSVRTGDVVRVTVASPESGADLLKPYQLRGVTVVIDPAVTTLDVDPALDVTRRLRALFEASGATVVVTRAANETPEPSAQVRAKRANEDSWTVGIGLDVATTGAAGRITYTPASGSPQLVGSSGRLGSAITSDLALYTPPAAEQGSANDPVFGQATAPWVRVRLGSAVAREDITSFSDPRWADMVARAVYSAVGEQFGLGGGQ